MPARRPLVDFMRRLSSAVFAPLGIAGVCAAWSLWATAQSGGPIEAAWTGGALVPVVLDAWAQSWRLVCAGWLHVDVNHATLNAPGLLIAGFALARLRGAAAVWTVWGVGAIAGCLTSWQFTQTWALGASGGNAALAGAVLWVAWRRWAMLTPADRRLSIFGSVPWLVLLLLPRDGPVDHAAHLAGALAGPLAAGAGVRIALALAATQLIAFGLMVHCALQPPLVVMTVPTTAPPHCPTAYTDGLLIRCETPTAPPAEGVPIDGRVHHRWQIGANTLLAPPGPRADRALAEIRRRFFDGSPDLR